MKRIRSGSSGSPANGNSTWWFIPLSALAVLPWLLSLVPRALTAFGLVMVLVHSGAITLPTFVGYSSVPPLGFSLALSHLAMAGWLVVKGFEERQDRLATGAQGERHRS